MTIILDLDYTLLDTGRFKEALASVFAACGIDEQRFRQTYRQTAEYDPSAYDYDLERHIRLIAEDLTCPADQLRAEVEAVLRRCAEFLYPGAKEFVVELRQRGFRVILMTMGNAGWQNMKVNHSGLAELFDETVLVRADKAAALSRFDTAEPPVFVVNDNYFEVRSMRAAKPNHNYIIKRGPKETRDDLGVPILDTFDQILEEIQRQIN